MSSKLMSFEGKIGKQPELKGEGDKAWTGFGVATEDYVGEGKGDLRDGQPTAYKTTWINVVAFGRQATYIADRFKQGDTIVVQKGKAEFNTYEKKDRDGNVIDSNALGIRVVLQDIAGPFRSAPRDNNGASNGNNNSQNAGGQRQAPSVGRGSATQSRQQSAPPARQQSRQAAPPPPQQQAAPAQQALIDDDIPF